jgi:hypothetical protein
VHSDVGTHKASRVLVLSVPTHIRRHAAGSSAVSSTCLCVPDSIGRLPCTNAVPRPAEPLTDVLCNGDTRPLPRDVQISVQPT